MNTTFGAHGFLQCIYVKSKVSRVVVEMIGIFDKLCFRLQLSFPEDVNIEPFIAVLGFSCVHGEILIEGMHGALRLGDVRFNDVIC